MTTRFNPCVIIPVYNHELPLPKLVERLEPYRLPCFLLDDGSDKVCAEVIQSLAARYPWVWAFREDLNRGKGHAVKAGILFAQNYGHSHAVQIDADGQHDLGDLGVFLAAARAEPKAVITGQPVFDESIPKLRYFGRYLTHLWVHINTLSLQIPDSMCGFRVYPVETCARLIQSTPLGNRMEFDTEILVRLYWQGVKVVSLPTRVGYPQDGISHFRAFADNALISLMHARLFFGMLRRFPSLLGRHFR